MKKVDVEQNILRVHTFVLGLLARQYSHQIAEWMFLETMNTNRTLAMVDEDDNSFSRCI